MNTAKVRAISSAPSMSSGERPRVPVAHDHVVQFYDNEQFLATAVANFLADGLDAGHAAIIVATPAHRDAVDARLRARGFDVAKAKRTGQIATLDARDLLNEFMVDGRPDAARFHTVVGGLITSALSVGHASVRAFGEMVDLLWKDGATDAALEVEELWNGLALTHPFSLLCAYAMGNFYKESHGHDFHEVCRLHAHVIPTEQFTEGDNAAQLLEVSLLQQRARALEAEIEHREELEARLRETIAARRSAEDALRIALDRERAAHEEAIAANTTKSQFLAAMSHELRTPLNAIAGHVELVQLGVYGTLNEAQRDALERVQRSGRSLLAMVTSVLNLARIQSGEVTYSAVRLPLAPLLDDLVTTFAPFAESRRVTLAWVDHRAARSDPPSVSADPDKARQILLNVVSNAIKFTPSGGSVEIQVADCTAQRDTACIRVSDTGIGIPANQLTRIFEPFTQLARPIDKRGVGVGLSLAISRDLALGMGGELYARSTVGAGATFTLLLPA